MHLAIDLDDVVLDFIGGVRHAFRTEYGVEGVKNPSGAAWGQDVVDFTTHPLFKASGYKDWWGWLRDRSWLWAKFPAIEGAIGGLKILRHDGHYLEAVTSKPEWAESNVWKWLGDWRAPFHQVTITKAGERKVDKTPAALIVDDKMQTCEEFVDEGRRAIFFDRAIPKRYSGTRPLLYEAHNWQDVVDTIRGLVNVHDADTDKGE